MTPVRWRRKRRQLWSLTLERLLALTLCQTKSLHGSSKVPARPTKSTFLRHCELQQRTGHRRRLFSAKQILRAPGHPTCQLVCGVGPAQRLCSHRKKIGGAWFGSEKNISKPSIRSLETCLRRQQHLHPRAEDFTRGTNLARFEEHRQFSQCLSSFSPKRRQGKSSIAKRTRRKKKKSRGSNWKANTRNSYGLFKAADKKLLKRDELTTGPTSSEQINEM